MRRYFILLLIVLSSSCNTSSDNKLDKAIIIRDIVKKTGLIELPWTHDLLKDKVLTRYSLNLESIDSIFIGDIESNIIGILPDTNNYFGILYYSVGDAMYPCITTFDKKGNKIDNSTICICQCAGIIEDFDTCIDKVTVTRDLKFNMHYKLVMQIETEDSLKQTIEVCNESFQSGYIDPNGKMLISNAKDTDCNK